MLTERNMDCAPRSGITTTNQPTQHFYTQHTRKKSRKYLRLEANTRQSTKSREVPYALVRLARKNCLDQWRK